jgi:hypothetical protein
VLKELSWFASVDGGQSWPAVKTLAERTGLTRRAVQKILRELEDSWLIAAEGSRLGGRNRPTRYRINLTSLTALAKTANSVCPFSGGTAAGHGRNTGETEKGERQDAQRANGKAEKGEPGSLEKKEHEFEKKGEESFFSGLEEQGKPLRGSPEQNPLPLKREGHAANEYQRQTIWQAVGKLAKAKRFDAAPDYEGRLRYLREQGRGLLEAEQARKRQGANETP